MIPMNPNEQKDPFGKFLFLTIILLVVAMVSLQVGIAKGRQMERDRAFAEAAEQINLNQGGMDNGTTGRIQKRTSVQFDR